MSAFDLSIQQKRLGLKLSQLPKSFAIKYSLFYLIKCSSNISHNLSCQQNPVDDIFITNHPSPTER